VGKRPKQKELGVMTGKEVRKKGSKEGRKRKNDLIGFKYVKQNLKKGVGGC